MQKKQEIETQGVTLEVTLSPQDAELLRAAVPAAPARRDTLGTKDTRSLAQTALGAIARALLREGYQPQPLGAAMRSAGAPDREPLPPGVIRLQLGCHSLP